jgi:hypothetical protein
MLTWTTRVLGMIECGAHTEQDHKDASDGQTCLIGEAGAVLDLRVGHTHWIDYAQTSAAIGAHVPSTMPRTITGMLLIGGYFPAYIHSGQYQQALDLCLAVEDAILAIKRERGSTARTTADG